VTAHPWLPASSLHHASQQQTWRISGHALAITGLASCVGCAISLSLDGTLLFPTNKGCKAVQQLARTLTENGIATLWRITDIRNGNETAWGGLYSGMVYGRPSTVGTSKKKKVIGRGKLCALVDLS
jgi:hypothetical protein